MRFYLVLCFCGLCVGVCLQEPGARPVGVLTGRPTCQTAGREKAPLKIPASACCCQDAKRPCMCNQLPHTCCGRHVVGNLAACHVCGRRTGVHGHHLNCGTMRSETTHRRSSTPLAAWPVRPCMPDLPLAWTCRRVSPRVVSEGFIEFGPHPADLNGYGFLE